MGSKAIELNAQSNRMSMDGGDRKMLGRPKRSHSKDSIVHFELLRNV